MSKNSKTANRATGLGAAKIRSIVSVPLLGESPKGGWSAEIRPEDSIHALIAVHTDAGHHRLWQRLHRRPAGRRPASRCWSRSSQGENALEPERVSEKLHQNTFWMGRGGTPDPCHQRHRHRALGHPGQGDRPAGRPAARRHLPPARAALLLAAHGGAGAACARWSRHIATGASAPSRSAGARSAARSMPKLDEAIVRAAREAAGAGGQALRRCRRQRRLLAARPEMGDAHGGDAEGLRRRLVRGGAEARRDRRFLPPAPRQPGADRRRRGADPAPELPPLAHPRRLRHRAARRHQGRRHQRAARASPGWPTISASTTSATAGTPRSASPPTCSSPPRLPDVDLVEFIGGSPYVDGITEQPFALDAEGYLEIPDRARPRRRPRSREARPLHAGPGAALRLRRGAALFLAPVGRHAVQLCTDGRGSTGYCNQSSDHPFP